MRICLINANTTAAMTERMVTLARPSAAGDVELFGATARFGAKYVASRAAYAVAGHAALDAYAEYGQDADAVVLACFGDPGLLALKEIAHQPVVGMAEAACLTAAALGGRFGVVTGGERWGPMLRELLGGCSACLTASPRSRRWRRPARKSLPIQTVPWAPWLTRACGASLSMAQTASF